jgi:hypothetical protein
MMENQASSNIGKLMLIRVAVWGQVIGTLWQNLALAIEDAPVYFERASIDAFIVPVLIVVLMYVLKADRWISGKIGMVSMAFLVLLASVATTVIAASALIYSSNIPDFLVTPGWRYAQTTSAIALVIFSVALVLNIIFIIRARRS